MKMIETGNNYEANLRSSPAQLLSVVEFDSDEVGVISSKWFTPLKEHAWWPRFKDSGKCNKALRSHHAPDELSTMWSKHFIKRVFFETSIYASAVAKCRASECKSDLSTDQEDEQAGLRKNPRRKIAFDEMDDSETDCDESLVRCAKKQYKSSRQVRQPELPNPPAVLNLKDSMARNGNCNRKTAANGLQESLLSTLSERNQSLHLSQELLPLTSPSFSCDSIPSTSAFHPNSASDNLYKKKTLESLNLIQEKLTRIAKNQEMILLTLQESGTANLEDRNIDLPVALPLTSVNNLKRMEDFLSVSGNVPPTVQ